MQIYYKPRKRLEKPKKNPAGKYWQYLGTGGADRIPVIGINKPFFIAGEEECLLCE